MATVYKTVTYSESNTRTTRALTTEELQEVTATLNNFKTYFVAKHLS